MTHNLKFYTLIGVSILGLNCSDQNHLESTTLIQNVLLVDGTGSRPKIASVRFQDDLIIKIGDLKPIASDSVVDGSDLVLSPGFIDGHSHTQIDHSRYVESAISQGITTVIIGVDGFSPYPLKEYFDSLEQYPIAVNVASYTGQNVLRASVMTEDFRREANEKEIQAMKRLVQQEMNSGALGLSTALEYGQGPFSSTAELIELCKVIASFDGVYSTHLRSYDRKFEEAVNEAFKIGIEAGIPVNFTHLQMGTRDLFGKAKDLLNQLDSVRRLGHVITADVYPYIRWSSSSTLLFQRGPISIEDAHYAVDQIVSPENLKFVVFPFDTTIEGKTLEKLALERNELPSKVLLDLVTQIRNNSDPNKHPGDFMIAQSTTEEDNRTFLAWEYSSISTDGWAGNGHPRSFGAFPKYFSQTTDVLLEEKIRKMTSLSAANNGLQGLGIIKPGAYADLVLFNPDELRDQATWEQPKLLSKGIIAVWVNGKLVYTPEGVTGKLPGRVIRKIKN